MKHFTVDTRDITKDQFEALKAAAEAAGLNTEYWEWEDHGKWPLIVTNSNLCSGEPSMRKGESDRDSLDETVTYPEALRRLAEAGGGKEREDEVEENMTDWIDERMNPAQVFRKMAENWESGRKIVDGFETKVAGRWLPAHEVNNLAVDAALGNVRRKPQKTPAQEAGFEVGDLVTVSNAGSPNAAPGDVLRLRQDIGYDNVEWTAVDSAYGNGRRFLMRIGMVRKLHNVKEA